MLTIENFEERLEVFKTTEHSFRDDWKIVRVNDSDTWMNSSGLEHYAVYVHNKDKDMTLEIRLWRNADEEFMTENRTREAEYVYKISFVDVFANHIIYEHFVGKTWLEKQPIEFMTRMVDIICDIVIDHPNNLYKGALPF